MKPNRRETISLLAGAVPATLGTLSVAGTTNPSHAEEAKPERRVATTGQGRPQKIETRIGTLEFTHDFANGYPTDATIEKLYDERDFQRACQAYLWSVPAVSFASWQRFAEHHAAGTPCVHWRCVMINNCSEEWDSEERCARRCDFMNE